jgi:rod shape-determining protein MreD
MTSARREIVLGLTVFLVALLLTILPLPDAVRLLRPQWAALALIFWIMAAPHRFGIITAWLLGIVVDLLLNSLLGLHALGFTLIAFIMLRLHKQFRVFPLWQQSAIVLGLLLMERFISVWTTGFAGQPAPSNLHWLAPFVGALLWPWTHIVLRDLQRRS